MDQNTKNGWESSSATAGAPNFTEPPVNSQQAPSEPGRIPATAKPPKPPLEATRKDVLTASLFFLCGYLFVRLVFESALGVGVTLFTIFYCGLVFFYLRPEKLPSGTKTCLLLIALSSLSFALIPNKGLKLFILFFLMACCLYGTAILCGTRISGKLDASIGPELLNQGVLIPFTNFFSNVRVIAAYKSKKGHSLLAILIGVLIALPLLGIIIPQLIRADAAFERAAAQFLQWFEQHLLRFVIWLPLSFLVGCYLYGHLYGNLHHSSDRITREEISGIQDTFQKLSPIVFGTTLTLVCAVYVLFLYVQATELLPALRNGAPFASTYAEYARRGFFELCAVSAFNLVIMGAAWLFTRGGEKRPMSQRILFAILSVETLCLISTAIGKMLLYVGRYGLTQKRVYTLWFMGFLALVFLLVLAAQFRRIPVVRAALLLFCTCFLILSYLNVNTLIVRYNINAYEHGALEELDVSAFYSMPAEALPRAAKLYDGLPQGGTKDALAEFIPIAKQQLQESSWHNQNLQTFLAAQTPLPEGLDENPSY